MAHRTKLILIEGSISDGNGMLLPNEANNYTSSWPIQGYGRIKSCLNGKQNKIVHFPYNITLQNRPIVAVTPFGSKQVSVKCIE